MINLIIQGLNLLNINKEEMDNHDKIWKGWLWLFAGCRMHWLTKLINFFGELFCIERENVSSNMSVMKFVAFKYIVYFKHLFFMVVSLCLHSGSIFPPSANAKLRRHKRKTLSQTFMIFANIWFFYMAYVEIAHNQNVIAVNINISKIHLVKCLIHTFYFFNCNTFFLAISLNFN